MVNRTEIVRWWKNAFERAGFNMVATTDRELMEIVAQCAAREVAARVEARGREGFSEPVGADD